MALWKAAGLFAVTSAILYFSIYICIKELAAKGLSFLQSYLICFYIPFVLLFAIALVAYKFENRKLSLSDFADRFRLVKMNKADWIWTLGLIVFSLGAYLALGFTGKLLAAMPLFSPPDYFPAEINPNKVMVPGIFMGTVLEGQWWIIPAYAAGWFFNIFGEELLWRGYILPRQELSYGKYAWIIHGVLWTLWHVFWKWNLLLLIPVTFSISFVVQHKKNTWIGIIAHGLANLIPLIVIVIGVIG